MSDQAFQAAFDEHISGRPYPKSLIAHKLPEDFDPAVSAVPKTCPIACNDVPYILYPKVTGEALPYSRADQIDYFQNANRFSNTLVDSRVGDVLYFGGAGGGEGHAAIVYKVLEDSGNTWVQPAGARRPGFNAGPMHDANGKPAFVRLLESGKVQGGSLIDGRIISWKGDVNGYQQWVGRGLRPR